MFEWIFGLGFVGILLVVVASIVWIWALIDGLQNPRLPGLEKLVWVLVILFTHLLVRLFISRSDGNAPLYKSEHL